LSAEIPHGDGHYHVQWQHKVNRPVFEKAGWAAVKLTVVLSASVVSLK